MVLCEYRLAVTDGARLAWLYQHGEIVAREDSEELISLSVRLLPADQSRFEQV
jgi:GTP-binding protein HflX